MFDGKLVFRGKLNEECSRYLKKKRIIEGIIVCGGTFIGTSPIAICLAFAISYWMFLSLIPFFMICLINVLFYDESFKSEPDEIDIDDMFLTGYCAKYDYKRIDYLSDVLEVTDMGTWYKISLATVYKGNIIKNLIMDCQSYTKYRPNETTGGIFVSWRRKEELPTGA